MRSIFATVLLLVALGCDAPPAPPIPEVAPPPTTPPIVPRTPHSSIAGRVVWSGPAPSLPPVRGFRAGPDGNPVPLVRPAPNVPAIDPAAGVGGAVVMLRGIDPAAARAWDHPPVAVELHDERPMVCQGGGPPRPVGFVRRGDAVTLVSRQALFHSLRARGAAFWTLAFPDPDRPLVRRFERPGLVELSSAAGYYWMHAYLWVSDHPYLALTDAAGRWELAGVPPGDYELAVWLPHWQVVRQERDPETTAVARVFFRRPIERVRRVTVDEGRVAVGEVSVGGQD